MVTYQPDVPLPQDARNKSQTDFLANYQYLAASIGEDHNFSLVNPNTLGPGGINNDGFHDLTHWVNQGTALQSGTPTPIVGVGQVYTKTVTGTGVSTSEQLCYQRGTNAVANDEICMTVMPIRAAVAFSSLAVIATSYNVSGVTQGATGVYTITFVKPMPTVNYIVSVSTSLGIGTITTKNVGNLVVTFVNGSGVGQSAAGDVIIFGG